MSERALNPKQERFVREYLVDMNGTQAAIRAGYSPKTANVQASDLLAKPNIRAEVTKFQAKLAQKHEITLDLLTEMTLDSYRTAKDTTDAKGMTGAVAQLSKMHGFDVGKRLNDRGPIEDLTAEERDAVREMVERALEKAREKETVE